jgi:signal transduction histidine kinase
MKSDFLSTAAHELRTPLASIYGFSELLLNRTYEQEASVEMIEIIHRQSLRLKQLLDELLDLSRIESRAGKDFYMVKNTIEKVVKDSCIDAEGAYKGRKVEDESSNYWPQLSFDGEKMHQVFINLLSNGFKYSTKSDRVILRTKTRYAEGEHQFGICIIDNGIGMAPQQLARLGERFYRADESDAVRGTGLGVTLVKEIVEIHGGAVDFVTSKGNGMEVTVWLPIVN